MLSLVSVKNEPIHTISHLHNYNHKYNYNIKCIMTKNPMTNSPYDQNSTDHTAITIHPMTN